MNGPEPQNNRDEGMGPGTSRRRQWDATDADTRLDHRGTHTAGYKQVPAHVIASERTVGVMDALSS